MAHGLSEGERVGGMRSRVILGIGIRRPGLLLPAVSSLILLTTSCSPEEGQPPPDDSPPPAPTEERRGDARTPAGAQEAAAGELLRLGSIARGFPSVRGLEGDLRARGDHVQWVDDDGLQMRTVYEFEDGRRIEEVASFGLRAGVVQTRWSWDETRGGEPLRRYEIDFERRTARGENHEGEEVERWSEELDLEPGRSFAGFGFTMALKAFHQRLLAGETIVLQAVGFTPGPQVVDVEISHAGRERMRMGGRTVTGDRFVIEPQVPFAAELFVEAPDTHLWLTDAPAGFLRSEGPLLEPDDPIVRIDLLPGEESGPAEPM